MGYSAEVVRRARARLAQEKEDRESENRQHLALASDKVPRIREIDHELRVTLAETAKAALLSGRGGRGWPGRPLQGDVSTRRPSAPSAAAAAMWVLPCANV